MPGTKTMHFQWLIALAALVSSMALLERISAQTTGQVVPSPNAGPEAVPTTQRILPNYPVRIGGVYTSGLSSDTTIVATKAVSHKLSLEKQDWIAANCDVIALSPTDIDRDTFPAINKVQPLFAPLLYLYASTLYETDHRGSVGGWRPEMRDWVLRAANGSEVPYPESGGHWMDFANADWATYWSSRAKALTDQYGAYGVVAAELPLGNTFTGANLREYHSASDRARATKEWLAAARPGYPNLLIPSAIGFDLAADHPTPAPKTPFVAPALAVRLWNDYFPLTDGAWCEGWIQPYWDPTPLSEALWETQMEAADRAGRLGQVFIAGAAYRNARELEFALASYLLVVHNQGRMVFQPMPVRAGQPTDAGFDLSVLQRELREKPGYFRVPLGRGMQERHQLPVQGGPVWRRNFEYGDVYVNSDERKTVAVLFAGKMRRLNGQVVSMISLPPHSGAILLYAPDKQGSVSSPQHRRLTPVRKRTRSKS